MPASPGVSELTLALPRRGRRDPVLQCKLGPRDEAGVMAAATDGVTSEVVHSTLAEGCGSVTVRPSQLALVDDTHRQRGWGRWGCSEAHAHLIRWRTHRRGWLSSAAAQTNVAPDRSSANQAVATPPQVSPATTRRPERGRCATAHVCLRR